MCGIVGIFDTRGSTEIDRELLNRMNESQYHRGPDAGGLHVEPGVGLGHRRLSIIDLSSGKQPMANEDETVWVTFNGEIYNFPQLSDELKAAGHTFHTHSDTEVIVHAWEEWGEQCVKRFRGMFAFAIWDRKQKILFLARDRLGKKPLHYSLLENGQLIFGSELKSLSTHPELHKEIDPKAVEEYFALGYVVDPRCIYKDIFKLPPASTLLIRQGQGIPEPITYWDISFDSKEYASEELVRDELVKRFKEAVDIRMMSEVPLGAFLSGGVDSSAVVAMMSQVSSSKINTCSIAFNDKKYNESLYAETVAKRYETNHVVETLDPDDFSLVSKLIDIYDEPYADSSALPTYRVCELAKKQVTVALSGDGADEYMSGYRRHQFHMNEETVRGRIPYSIRKPVFGILGKLYPKLDWAPQFLRAKSTFQALARDSVGAYFHSVSQLNDDTRQQLFSDDFKQQLQGYNAVEVFRKHAAKSPSDHPLSLIEYLDMKTYLVGDIHTKVDRASMANSMEVRAPLLDHELIDWVSGLQPELKLKGQEGKYIFKKSMEPYLPHDVLYRKKMGFSVPLASWFKGPLKDHVKQTLQSKHLVESRYFNMPYVQKLVDQHIAGSRDNSVPIWSLLMFESFLSKST